MEQYQNSKLPGPTVSTGMKSMLTQHINKKEIETEQPIIASPIYCCIIHITWKKNNVFVNLTKMNGETIIKFTAGLIQKRKSGKKKQLSSLIKWIFEKITFFAKVNFSCAKIIIKGCIHSTTNAATYFNYLKEIKRVRPKGAELRVLTYQYHIPVLHNGCKPPKLRRI
jgi:ribosomal protein S11